MWSSEPLSSIVPAAAAGDSVAYTNFIARTDGGLDAAHLAAYKALLNGLTTDGLFNPDGTTSVFDFLFVMASQNEATAVLNLVNNGAYFVIPVNVAAFVPDLISGGSAACGYVGNGSNGSLGTNYNPVSGANWTQNAAHLSCWNLSNISDHGTAMASGGSQKSGLYPNFDLDNVFYARCNENTSPGYGVLADPRGHLLGSRTASNLTTGYQNGASVGTVTTAADAVDNANLNLLSAGSGSFSSYRLVAASAGGPLTGAQVTSFYTRLRTYMTAVGVP